MGRKRLDLEMVRRGLAASPEEAGAVVLEGRVTVGGRPVRAPASLVARADAIAVAQPDRRFVSRGGEKLDAALEALSVDVAGKDALDVGASSGGFTDCLLQRGANRVIAADVAYGQLAWTLRTDPRVTVMERTNVRDLNPATLPFRPALVVGDLSFIGLRAALPALVRVAAARADLILLVKPQFEAERGAVGSGGVVRDPGVWRAVLAGVVAACREAGAMPQAVSTSPLLGPAGNVEFFLHARLGGALRADPALEPAIEDAVRIGAGG